MYQEILYTTQERLAIITLNREASGNALARDSYGEIENAIIRAQEDPAIGAILIRSTGKHFSAGGDIKRFKALIESKEYLRAGNIAWAGKMTSAIRACPKPVVAMVQGLATGAGCSLAVACDFRMVTPSTKLAMGFIKMGLSGDTGSIYFLHKLVGIAKASEMLMLGDAVRGEEAVRIGLATAVHPEEQFEQASFDFAKKLANGPTFAFARQKELLMRFFYHDLAAYSIDEAESIAACSRTDDFAEAVNAFLEKRPAIFQGK